MPTISPFLNFSLRVTKTIIIHFIKFSFFGLIVYILNHSLVGIIYIMEYEKRYSTPKASNFHSIPIAKVHRRLCRNKRKSNLKWYDSKYRSSRSCEKHYLPLLEIQLATPSIPNSRNAGWWSNAIIQGCFIWCYGHISIKSDIISCMGYE